MRLAVQQAVWLAMRPAMRPAIRQAVWLAVWWWPLALFAQPGQTVRIAFIDPLSGPASDVGRNSLRTWQFMARHMHGAQPHGVRFVVAGFDNQGSPRQSLDVLKAAIDQGFRYVVQGNGSGVATALSDAITRHNARHPERAVLFLNYAASDPALTNEKCSFWHFRLDADTAMKTQALARFLGSQPALKKIYLLNQNYAHGKQVALYLRRALAQQRLPIEIVGDELHPAFVGEDFEPYVRRLAASGAQALVSGNWGADLRDLVRAMQQQGLRIPLYAYYPSLKGVPQALAEGGYRLPVYQVAYNHTNQGGAVAPLADAFRREHGEDLVVYAAYDGLALLQQGMQRAGSTDPVRVAPQLGGLRFEGFNGPVLMRADDHQLLKGLYISRWQAVDAQNPRSAEGTSHTFAPVQYLEATEISPASQCQMERPRVP